MLLFRFFKLSAFIFISLAILSACHSQVSLPPAQAFILKNVNIVSPVEERIIKNQTILVKNGIISSINSSLHEIPGINIIDAQGGYVTPGLIDMHVHFYDPSALVTNLSHGVTHVRIMNGIAQHLAWRDQLAQNERVGSTLSVSSPILSGFENGALHQYVATTQQAEQAVITAKNAGYDLIKAYGNLSPQALKALIKTAQTLNIPVAKHGPHPSADMPWSSLSELQSLEHVEDILQGPLNHTFDQQKLTQTLKEIKKLNIPVTPTLNIFWQLTRISEDKQAFLDTLPKHYISPIVAAAEQRDQVARWLNTSQNHASYNRDTYNTLLFITEQMHTLGIELLVGSDAGVLLSPHGLATHNEMAQLKDAGLTNFAVLKAATYSPARALKLDKQIGQIKVGYKADFIFTRINPIENLASLKTPVAVSKHGRWLTQQQLTRLRAQAIENRSTLLELWRLASNY
ncbi:amidohydrolase family protein [Pseudoalteromonas sp. MMG022]|uniref:amidohydrolase family protein n=1 Tax=Pseudoalteromonas sp. MMG022 TaxID=2909978 RepID=UPI001F28DE9E|nr:amidohydrolase family protein [Pseudoalteromonas sp. MMG022]MCF6437096.1 amidohydrolase family protein [Pseudoalteromonas sp. MMG022]